MANAKVKTVVSPLIGFIGCRRALRSVRPARINCKWNIPSLTGGPHHDRGGHATARRPSSRRSNRRTVAGGHIRLPTPPLHARPQRLKRRARGARLQSRLRALNDPVPY
jgi:hypothetical protein